MSDDGFSRFLERQLKADEPDYPRLLKLGAAYQEAAGELLARSGADEELAAKALYLLSEFDPVAALPNLLIASNEGGPALRAGAMAGLARTVNHVREKLGLLARTFDVGQMDQLMPTPDDAAAQALHRLANAALYEEDTGVRRAAQRALYSSVSEQPAVMENREQYHYTVTVDGDRVVVAPPQILVDQIATADEFAKHIDNM